MSLPRTSSVVLARTSDPRPANSRESAGSTELSNGLPGAPSSTAHRSASTGSAANGGRGPSRSHRASPARVTVACQRSVSTTVPGWVPRGIQAGG
ncbi:hypothetical protein [Streptomyces sp. NPDC088261]|uniref:hypothetical protein n=1 Tax=Streptomyces sp. NPDC088261 TaxID=3365851 RepID=UPI0037FF1E57